ncbi:hypothetical protein MCOR27_008717 [Pyricularia oryzae]|uniref:Ubiquitin-conjugating enzyme E2-binding protein n=1 Tax=Pyricularia grisea TaxID=148305 RepID=A0ABQ8NKB2_PYRGI|nr:hypothetical protein MCOR01_007784 [Pyricularia oryzae]KAI6298424.1 hypothetical protein MCOR33_005409 [Pyricularia grisea]KAI6253740.1 hypothetical protein MCOR19_009718 [Pyricularia oryzae]KAI6264985.1 hypothetical protein MCOR26_011015 [Pyricularia oryzae]KAI6271672.1 hypothetical protein MCOR27_008717 [Pyricularia oryzae]
MTDNFSIYAELLPNIRQVSVVASLPSPCDSSTRALLLSDGSRIHVTHHDDSRLLELPAAVVQGGGGSPAILPLKPAADNGCKLTWRFPLDLAYSASAAPQGAIATGGGAGSSVPWEAVNIAGGSTVLCRGCKAVLVPGERIKEWKDLPSANWAEMMEFWHCHKPDDHDAEDGHRHHGHDYDDHRIKGGDKADEQTLAGRGYGANSSIQAQRGVGFVDLMTFLFAEDECRGVEISPREDVDASSAVRFLPAKCAECHTKIGHFSIRSPAVTLYKWQLLLDSGKNKNDNPPSAVQCLAASLLANVARSGSSKSLIIPMTGILSGDDQDATKRDRALHTWILNSTISYTSTLGNTTKTPAVKLLFKVIGEEEADKMLESFSSDVQDVSLSEETLECVIDALERSNKIIPASDRNFQGWTVGLSDRWDSGKHWP